MRHAAPPIDFVITWVDDSDDVWRAQRESHRVTVDVDPEAVAPIRARDWGLLRYWFRAVAAYAPWVNHVYLVTENPVPDWMNEDSDRLTVVTHADFIPAEYLPTFNSRAIELNLHRIPGLSEHFVYFNDDMYLNAPISPDHFFADGLPRAFAVMTPLSIGNNFHHAMLNNLDVLNKHFSKPRAMRQAWRRWFSPRYGAALVQNIALLPWRRFMGFHNHHLALPMRISTAERVWDLEFTTMDQTSRSRFRELSNVNPFVLTWWAICAGEFMPASMKGYGRYFAHTDENLAEIVQAVSRGTDAMLCLNDGELSDFEADKASLIAAFDAKLPVPSEFERR